MEHKSDLQNCAKGKLEIKSEIDTDQCIICKEEFGTFELEIHAINCKGEEKVDIESNDTKPFQSTTSLEKVSLLKNKQCDVCKKYFKSTQYLNLHKKRIHDKIKDQNCEFCGQCFASKTELTTSVPNGKPY